MVRKLAIAAFALSALSSGVAQALGLGEATVQSSLNQPLTAEIQLVNVRDLEGNEILTGLAGREDFVRAGVERVFFLSDLRFKVEMGQDGGAVIKVTSSKPVREPFLNFLVEVNWPTGRLMREYALLIDPPTFGRDRAAPVQLASTPEQSERPAPAPPVQPTVVASEPRMPASTVDNSAQNSDGGGTYGPTVANDTMWSIALRTRPNSGVSPQKMMLAIQDLNPDAFLSNNINRLKKGQVLRLPTTDEINVRSSREAIAAVVVQNQAFQERSESTVEATSQQQESPASSDQGRDELRIVVDQTTDSIKSSPSSTGTGRSASGTDTVAGSSNDVLLQEQMDLTNRENEDLKDRLEELRQQLETMQRLVALKDDQLAALQGETALENERSGTEQDPEASATDVALNMAESAGQTGTEGDPANLTSAAASDNRLATTEATQSGDAQQNVAQQNKVQQQTVAGSQETQASVPAEARSMPDQIIHNIKNNVLWQGAIAAGGLLLLLLLWLSSRRKGEEEDEVDQTVLPADREVVPAAGKSSELAADDAADPIAEADVYLAYQKHDQAARVLEDALETQPENQDYRLKLLEVLGESKKAGKFVAVLAALEATGDADILTRASSIKERFSGLSSEPEVSLDDLESQLLSGDGMVSDEDLANTELSKDFELDVDMGDSAGLDDTIKQSEAEADFLETNAFDLSSEIELDTEDDLDIDFDLSDIELDDKEASLDGAGIDLGDIDFDEDDLKAPAGQDAGIMSDSLQDIDDGDTLLSPMSLDESFDEDSLSGLDESKLVDETELDNEFAELDDAAGFTGEKTAARPADKASDEVSEESLELDLDDLDISLDEITEPSFDKAIDQDFGNAAAADADSANIDLESTLNASPDETIVQPMPAVGQDAGGEDPVADMEDDFDFLSDTDEAATKLDLARAYVDMGDKEGARDILEEVAEEGSSEQKLEAMELLKSLD